MNQADKQRRGPDDEIDLRALIFTLWSGRLLIFATTIVFALTGVAYAVFQPNIYQASVLVAPVDEDSRGVGGINGQLGGLASLAGISFGGGNSDKTVFAREILQSRAFLRDFIRRHDLSKPLIATKGWDSEVRDWVYDQSKYDPAKDQWALGWNGQSQKPTDWQLVEVFKEDHLRVNTSKETGMITISMKSYSPFAAQKWASAIVSDINEHMRKEDVEEAEARVKYLEKKLRQTDISEMKQIFYQLIEQETRKIMLANAKEEYVFQTVDPAVVPEEKSEPNRTLIVIFCAFLGIAISVGFLLIRSFAGVLIGIKESE